MASGKGKSWLDFFTKLQNRELRALYTAPYASPVQCQIVLYVLAQTRGTGRIMAGDLKDADYDEWQEATAPGSPFGRDAAHLFVGSIASALGRDERTVRRELRRLIDAGMVVQHDAGRKGRGALLSVDLEPARWDLTCLNPRVDRTGKHRASTVLSCAGVSARHFKRRETSKNETLKSETADSVESTSSPDAVIATPRLKDLTSRFLERADSGVGS